MHNSANVWDDLVSVIGKMARTPGRATTHGPSFDVAFDPVSIQAFEDAERQLGFQLPPLLKRLYTEVGNGGFGPGHGLLSTVPLSSVDRPMPLYYSTLRSRRGDWPVGVVPFSDWGCLIVSCVDLSSDSTDPPVLRFEPNMSHADTVQFWKDKAFRGTGLVPESDKLSSWFEDWINGKEMFERPYALCE
jgi:SMI1 / KNR4 family (SUKH-1)